MDRLYFDIQLLNNMLTGKASTKRRVGKVKTASGEFKSIFLATDEKTQKPRRARSGDLVFNVKPQKEDGASNEELTIVNLGTEDSDVWADAPSAD